MSDAFSMIFTPEELRRKLSGELGKYLKKLGNSVEREAKQIVHVDTGRLRASITNELGEDAQGQFVVIGSDVDYAAAVEAQYPYLVPAAAQVAQMPPGGGS